MSDSNDKKNIISFPDQKSRKDRAQDKKRAEKESSKEDKKRERMEAQYRAQYQIRKAREQSNRNGGSNSNSFINWDKIPPFTRAAAGLMILIQIAITIFAYDPSDKTWLFYHYGFVPAVYTDAQSWHMSALLAPVSSLLIHGGWTHLVFNMVMMLAMGVFFEREFGARRAFVVFLFCGIMGNIAYLLINPSFATPVVGASGAISGLFAVAFSMMIERGMLGGPFGGQRGTLPFVLLWSTIIIVFGFFSSDISWQSHLGGFLSGVAFYQLWKRGKIRF